MKTILMVLILMSAVSAQTKYNNVNKEIAAGNFSAASQIINELLLNDNLSEEEKYDLNFQIEKMNRIRKDFRKTREDILRYIRKYYPDAGDEDLARWEKKGSLEYKIIDGDKKYFNRAHTNLFRLDKEAKTKKSEVDGYSKDKLDEFLEEYLPQVLSKSGNEKTIYSMQQDFEITYKLKVDADAVPGGEVIRCWLPYPRENHKRQFNVDLISVNCDNYIVAPENINQRTLYLEKKAENGLPTEFEYTLRYSALNFWNNIIPENIKEYDTNSELYKEYTAERKPHIVFSDQIKELSDKIVGDETNKFIIAKKIYKWINDNIPWAGAREYSTLDNIPEYCITNGHGDCGIKTLTFMTLARYNGIPVKWQSGWMLHPGSKNLHDWAEMYLEGYGWVPVDQSFGLNDSDDEKVKWFFLGGIDAFHLIVNDDYSSDLYPAKIYPRSETVDFQRGEAEWRGGNLYFDKWDYHMDVKYIKE